jgi:hypothetical protein
MNMTEVQNLPVSQQPNTTTSHQEVTEDCTDTEMLKSPSISNTRKQIVGGVDSSEAKKNY